MARPATNLSVRLKKLESAQSRIKGLKRGTLLTSMPTAELLGVRWPTLRDWCNEITGFEDSGAFVRGGNGIEWEFDPHKTLAFLLKHFRGNIAAQAKKSRAQTKAIGAEMPDSEVAPTLAETKDLVNLTLTLEAAKERQNHFTPTRDTAAFLSGYNQHVVDGIMGVRTKVDPNGKLPPNIRKAIDGYLRGVASDVHAKAQAYIGDLSAGSKQAGVG